MGFIEYNLLYDFKLTIYDLIAVYGFWIFCIIYGEYFTEYKHSESFLIVAIYLRSIISYDFYILMIL